jgi:hypothetical protein
VNTSLRGNWNDKWLKANKHTVIPAALADISPEKSLLRTLNWTGPYILEIALPLRPADGHHLINKSAHLATVLEIGNSDPRDRCVYSDIDMVAEPGVQGYRHRDGLPYPAKAR